MKRVFLFVLTGLSLDRVDDDGIDDSLDEDDDEVEEENGDDDNDEDDVDGEEDDEDEDEDEDDEEGEAEADEEDAGEVSVAADYEDEEQEGDEDDEELSDLPVEEEDDEQPVSDDDSNDNFKINDEDDLEEPEEDTVQTAPKKRSLSLKIKVPTASSSKSLADDDEDDDEDMYTDEAETKKPKIAGEAPVKRKVGRPRKSDLASTTGTVGRPKRGGSTRVNYDDELDDDEELMSDSENIIPTPALDDELLLTDEEAEYIPDITKMTERQRAKLEMEEAGSQDDEVDQSQNHQLLSLSNNVKQRRVLTEEENQLRKAEIARKRKNLTERKLEEEKQETINKLLKRKAGKVTAATMKEDEEINLKEKPRRPQIQHEALFTWVSKRDSFALRVPEPLMK